MIKIPDFRFYITLFHSDSYGSEKILPQIEPILKPLVNNLELKIKHIDKFPYRQYDQLSVLEIKIGEIDTSIDPKPSKVFELSNTIKTTLAKLNDEIYEIMFDDLNLYPYAITIASGIGNEQNLMWTKENLEKHKEELGSWVEYYSGHYDDYSDELYRTRIANNLSNRLSELHYIRSNSAFIYMERHDPRWKNWMDYMESYFIDHILLARSITYVLMVLNMELDQISKRIRKLPPGAIKRIEEELKFIEELRLLVVEITSKLTQEKLMNRLSHSTKIVNECFNVFSIDNAYHLIDDKISQLQIRLEKEQRTVQMQLQSQQKRWILILNALIGYQVAFNVLDRAANFFGFQNTSLYDLLDGLIWAILLGMVIFVIGGFIITFLKTRKKIQEE